MTEQLSPKIVEQINERTYKDDPRVDQVGNYLVDIVRLLDEVTGEPATKMTWRSKDGDLIIAMDIKRQQAEGK